MSTVDPSFQGKITMDTISTLSRTLKILEAFDTNTPALRLTDIAEKVKLHKSTVYRLLSFLVSQNYLLFEESTKRYRLGYKFLTLASVVLSHLDLTDIARPIMRELVEETNQTANLAILDRDAVIYIAKVEPSSSIRISTRIGARVPAYCTALGKVLLANMPQDNLNGYLSALKLSRFTKATIINKNKLKQELKKIRETGFALDHEEFLDGLVCVAYPIFDYKNEAVAALSISGPVTVFKEEQITEWTKLLKLSSQRISEQLGYRPK